MLGNSEVSIADIGGALSFRQAQMDKEEEKRREIRFRQLAAQAIPDLPEGSPVREMMLYDPVRAAAIAHAIDIPLNKGDQFARFSSDIKRVAQLAHADIGAAHDYVGSLIPEYQKMGMSTSKLQQWYDNVSQAVDNNDENGLRTQYNALGVMNDALNPSKPDYEMMKIQNEQAKLAQEDKYKAANLSIEQQKLALERDKTKQGDTSVTYQQDENGNFVALPTKLPAGGAPVSAPVLDAQGNPIKGKGQPLTESQSNAALFAARAKESQKIINDIGTDYSVSGLNAKRAVEWLPAIGAAANAMLSDKQQSVEQAQRDFINAVLRKESGASIAPAEFQNAQKQYFPQTGDSEAVIKQKNENRKTAIAGLEIASGNGAKMVEAKQNENKATDAPKKSLTYNPQTGKFE